MVRKGLKRSPMKRNRKPIRPRNPERKVRTFARKFGSVERVAWFKAQPCQTCGSSGPCENSHLLCGGPPKVIISQCRRCHEEFHRLGRWSFADSVAMSFEQLLDLAVMQNEEWLCCGKS